MFEWIKSIANPNGRSYPKSNRRQRRPNSFRPRLEVLEDRLAPATVNMYWDPTNGANASTMANWDTGSLGSGVHPAAAPGNTAGETDNIYFDGTVGKAGNKSCTWDYTPANSLGSLWFQNGWIQTVTFQAGMGLKVSDTSAVGNQSKPHLAPSNGGGGVAAITLTNGALFNVDSGSSLFLTGTKGGGAVFFAGDGKLGERLANGGEVTYTGLGQGGSIP